MKLPPDIQAALDAVLPPERAVERAGFLQEYTDSLHELRDRFVRAYGELVLHEIEYLVLRGWPKEESYLPAVNNLAVRKKEIEDELITALAQLQSRLRQRLAHLLDEPTE